MQVGETTIRLGTLGGYPSPLLKQGESHPQTPVFVEFRRGRASDAQDTETRCTQGIFN